MVHEWTSIAIVEKNVIGITPIVAPPNVVTELVMNMIMVTKFPINARMLSVNKKTKRPALDLISYFYCSTDLDIVTILNDIISR